MAATVTVALLGGCDAGGPPPAAPVPVTTTAPVSSAAVIAGEPPSCWGDVADRVAQHLEATVRHAALAEDAAALRSLDEAYFGTYEAPVHNLEVAVRRNQGIRRVAEVEDLFARLRVAIEDHAPATAVRTLASQVAEAVREDARSMTELGVSMEDR